MDKVIVLPKTVKEVNLITDILEKLNFSYKIESDSIEEKKPNKITLKAMKAAEEGNVTKAKNVKDLMAKLAK